MNACSTDVFYVINKNKEKEINAVLKRNGLEFDALNKKLYYNKNRISQYIVNALKDNNIILE